MANDREVVSDGLGVRVGDSSPAEHTVRTFVSFMLEKNANFKISDTFETFCNELYAANLTKVLHTTVYCIQFLYLIH